VSSETERINRRSGGRSARVALRQAPQEINPAPPGPLGGHYKPLSELGLKAIYDTSIRLLAELGMGEVPKRFEELALSKGAYLNAKGRLCYSRELVEGVIAGAAKSFVYHGRDPKHDFEIGVNVFTSAQVVQPYKHLTLTPGAIAHRP
jgi:trimethylamine---corrinoid protein Co-methyltransferase